MAPLPLPPRSRAFTLMELLVVIAVIAILAALLLPVLASTRKQADEVTCSSNLRHVMMATLLAAQDNTGRFPAMKVFPWDSDGFLLDSTVPNWTQYPPAKSIGEVLLPYLSGGVGNSMNTDPSKIAPILKCPAAARNKPQAWINNYANYRYNGYATGRVAPRDSATQAMLFTDVAWPDWPSIQFSHYPGTGALIHVAYADGHVTSMGYTDYVAIDPVASAEYQHNFFENGWIQAPVVP